MKEVRQFVVLSEDISINGQKRIYKMQNTRPYKKQLFLLDNFYVNETPTESWPGSSPNAQKGGFPLRNSLVNVNVSVVFFYLFDKI